MDFLERGLVIGCGRWGLSLEAESPPQVRNDTE